MKEKYTYESVKDGNLIEGTVILVGAALLLIAFIQRDSFDKRILLTMIFIAISIFICLIAFYNLEGRFNADDTSVTFGKIFKRKIEYSSIKSIDLRKEKREYTKAKGYKYNGHSKYTSLTEIITFHCEDGDHSFACVLVPYHEYKKPGEPSSMFAKDWSESTFSRLKNYIESKGR
jgi:hypothetical protein